VSGPYLALAGFFLGLPILLLGGLGVARLLGWKPDAVREREARELTRQASPAPPPASVPIHEPGADAVKIEQPAAPRTRYPDRPPLPQLCAEIKAAAAGLERRHRALVRAYGEFRNRDDESWRIWSNEFGRELYQFRDFELRFKEWGLLVRPLEDVPVEEMGGYLIGAATALGILSVEYERKRRREPGADVATFTEDLRTGLRESRRAARRAGCR
jgi:hypothetical protein